MQLLIMRHGDAVDDAPGLGDDARWLSGKGRTVTRRVASWLAEKHTRRPAAIWTSPLVRAVQTAEIVAEACGLTDLVSVAGALSTRGDPDHALRDIAGHQGPLPLMLVGHEPSLSHLAMKLLGAIPWPGFKKSGVLAVDWSRGAPAQFGFLLVDPKELKIVHHVDKLV